MDGGEAFGPGSAEELHEDGLGLVVEGVGGEDGVGVAGGEEGAEEVVADVAGGFFDGLAVLGGAGGDVGVVEVEGNVELNAEVLDEGEVGVGFGGSRMPWWTWTAERPTPRASRAVVLAAWRARRRATESAPPETATQRRSPGWMCSRLKGRLHLLGHIKGNEAVGRFDSYTKHMFEVRPATGEDAEEIAAQRRKMYVEMGDADEAGMQGMVDAFVPWVRERLVDGRYLGWMVRDGDVVVAGAGMFLMDFPPHWRDVRSGTGVSAELLCLSRGTQERSGV